MFLRCPLAQVRVGAAVDQRDIQDWTPLMHAAEQGHGEAIEALIECGADPMLVCDTQVIRAPSVRAIWDRGAALESS